MAYKKPEVVAKSETKQSFVGGCPGKTIRYSQCTNNNAMCAMGPLK